LLLLILIFNKSSIDTVYSLKIITLEKAYIGSIVSLALGPKFSRRRLSSRESLLIAEADIDYNFFLLYY
jgi:hypothetical protein